MQAAIDLVFRNFSLRPLAWLTGGLPADRGGETAENATVLASELFNNYKAKLADRGTCH